MSTSKTSCFLFYFKCRLRGTSAFLTLRSALQNGRCVTALTLRLRSRMGNVAALKGDSVESCTPPPTPKYPPAIYRRCKPRRAPRSDAGGLDHRLRDASSINRTLCKRRMLNEAESEDRREEGRQEGMKTCEVTSPVEQHKQQQHKLSLC